MVTIGAPWPRNVEDMLEYMEARASEPCARSVLRTVLGLLFFFERGGGVPGHMQISKDPVLLSAVEEMTAQLTGGGDYAHAEGASVSILARLRPRGRRYGGASAGL